MRFYIRVCRETCGDEGVMSSVWDSRYEDSVGKRFPYRPRRTLMIWLNEFRGRVISIYTDDTGGTKELIAWLESDA